MNGATRWVAPTFAQIILAAALFSECDAFAVDSDLQKASALNDSAVKKLREKNLDGAELDLLQALEYAEGDARLRKNLGVVYYEKGVRALHQKNFYDAQNHFNRALTIEPGNAHYKRGLAAAVYLEAEARADQGRSQEALSLFRKAATLDPSNPDAWIHAADYAWSIQHMKEASEFLGNAKALGASGPNVRVLEERLRQGEKESHFETESSEHFILSAESAAMAEKGDYRILYDLEDAYEEASYKLGLFPKNKITVVFYPSAQFHGHWGLAGDVSGYYDGKLRIPYAAGGGGASLGDRGAILHELTHAFLNSASAAPIPRWLNEGLAQWVEEKELDAGSKRALLAREKKGELPPLAALDQALLSASSGGEQATLAYMKSLSVTQYLIRQQGIGVLCNMVREYPNNVSAEAFFKKKLGMDFSEINDRWREWLESEID